MRYSHSESDMVEPLNFVQSEFNPILSRVKVISTVFESLNSMKKLVLLVDNNNNRIGIDEQIQNL